MYLLRPGFHDRRSHVGNTIVRGTRSSHLNAGHHRSRHCIHDGNESVCIDDANELPPLYGPLFNFVSLNDAVNAVLLYLCVHYSSSSSRRRSHAVRRSVFFGAVLIVTGRQTLPARRPFCQSS